jgi:hypothetical protein
MMMQRKLWQLFKVIYSGIVLNVNREQNCMPLNMISIKALNFSNMNSCRRMKRNDSWKRLEIHAYEILVGIPEGMRQLGKPKRN